MLVEASQEGRILHNLCLRPRSSLKKKPLSILLGFSEKINFTSYHFLTSDTPAFGLRSRVRSESARRTERFPDLKFPLAIQFLRQKRERIDNSHHLPSVPEPHGVPNTVEKCALIATDWTEMPTSRLPATEYVENLWPFLALAAAFGMPRPSEPIRSPLESLSLRTQRRQKAEGASTVG